MPTTPRSATGRRPAWLTGAVRWIRLSLLAILAAAPAFPGAAVVHAETVEVIVTTFEFIPRDVTIAEGDSIRWIWDFGTHTVTEGSNCTAPENPLFDVEITPADSVFTYGFATAGVYDYFCRPHCVIQGMEGTIIVNGASGAPEGGRVPSASLEVSSFPNPFTEGTEIQFRHPDPDGVRVEIVGPGGTVVRTLQAEGRPADLHSLHWDATDDAGRQVAAGVYFVRVVAGGAVAGTRLVVLR